jgi:hypothetical protein
MEYKSTIKSRQYFFLETKKVSNLVLQGLNPAEIKAKAVEENIFLVNLEVRKKEIAATVLKRLRKHIRRWQDSSGCFANKSGKRDFRFGEAPSGSCKRAVERETE